jgi:hypothetical protein
VYATLLIIWWRPSAISVSRSFRVPMRLIPNASSRECPASLSLLVKSGSTRPSGHLYPYPPTP